MGYEELKIEGRNVVLEAFRSGKTIDKLFVLDGCQDGPVRTIVREAKKHDTIVHFVEKERLDQRSHSAGTSLLITAVLPRLHSRNSCRLPFRLPGKND